MLNKEIAFINTPPQSLYASHKKRTPVFLKNYALSDSKLQATDRIPGNPIRAILCVSDGITYAKRLHHISGQISEA